MMWNRIASHCMIEEGQVNVKWFLFSFIAFLIAFGVLGWRVLSNAVTFSPDEFYWIGTGRIIPALAAKDYTSPVFKELYGYANFNGAKFIYGITNILTGNPDLSFIGYPPETTYRFSLFGTSFPADHPYESILLRGRLVSALFASAAIGLIVYIYLLLFAKPLGAFISAGIVLFHPVFQSIGTTAFADSFFLFFELAVVVLLELYKRAEDDRLSIIYLSIGAIALGYLTSIKLNGGLFVAVAMYYLAQKNEIFGTYPTWTRMIFHTVSFFLLAICTFMLVQYNYFLPESPSIWYTLESRMNVTLTSVHTLGLADNVELIWSLPSRVLASIPLVFRDSPMGLLFIFTILFLFMRKGKVPWPIRLERLLTVTTLVYGAVILYVIFNEPRYFLPFLPLLAIVAGYPFGAMLATKGDLTIDA